MYPRSKQLAALDVSAVMAREEMNKQMEESLGLKHLEKKCQGLLFLSFLHFEKQPKLLPRLTCNSGCPSLQESPVRCFFIPPRDLS